MIQKGDLVFRRWGPPGLHQIVTVVEMEVADTMAVAVDLKTGERDVSPLRWFVKADSLVALAMQAEE